MTKVKSTTKPKVVPTVLGIDLAKNSIHVHGVGETGTTGLDKKMTPTALKKTLSNLTPCLIGLEACGRSHQWAREIRAMGHTVKIIAPQFIRPYVMSNKNDRADAMAICEAVQRPNMRFVGIKSAEQQAQLALHRIRSQAVANRTALVNQIRGLLAEFGIEIAQGRSQVRKRLPTILGDGGSKDISLDPLFMDSLSELYDELVHMDDRVDQMDQRIEAMARANVQTKLLMTIPGIGPLTATALASAMADTSVFKNGREFSAWLGLVPRQHSTGGKDRLLGISKRGDRYLRCLLVHGARSVMSARSVKEKPDARSQWMKNLLQRCHRNVATVALANRMARTAWAVLNSGEPYRDNHKPAMLG